MTRVLQCHEFPLLLNVCRHEDISQYKNGGHRDRRCREGFVVRGVPDAHPSPIYDEISTDLDEFER